MTMPSLTVLFIVMCEVTSSPLTQAQTVPSVLYFSVMEEDGQALVGDVRTASGIDNILSDVDREAIRFKFLTQSSQNQEYFAVDPTTGVLRTVQPIDRDVICEGVTSACEVEVDVATEPRELLYIFRVVVTVSDINDNPPRFEENSQLIQIPESTASGAAFPLASAYDPDIGMFGIQGFKLDPQLPSFALEANVNPDGS